ncbi:hypothetical protein [Prevotella sp. 10(H)]|uniref:hypothetical protein n=1 Tax=Prevotella sp. 10(H) TaxID=1158294 RepID=UPI0004A72D9B|nr:hypothetical protein [Prevotella sp. 10(H)]
MRKGYIKYVVIIFIVALTALGVTADFHRQSEDRRIQEFDVERFRETGYTDEELSLFCDIAFNRDGERIRKWETDLRVEIENIAELGDEAVDEVDSVISILRPLIAPLKIERVSEKGNVIVHKNVELTLINKPRQKPTYTNGIARINEATDHSWNINFAHIYDGPTTGTQTLMHEFEHILGLEHPMMLYEYYLTIGRSSIPQHYSAYGDWFRFHRMPYYISPREKAVIRMLYSPEIRSGLKRDEFIKRMGIELPASPI